MSDDDCRWQYQWLSSPLDTRNNRSAVEMLAYTYLMVPAELLRESNDKNAAHADPRHRKLDAHKG